MKRIEVKLSLPVVAPLLDVIKTAADTLQGSLAAPLGVQDIDPEFREAWTDDLLKSQNDELGTLLALFDKEFFSTGTVSFDEDNAEIIVRACAALRLRLRGTVLKAVTDEALESGDIAVETLTEGQRTAFMCYLFLATIQDLIIQHIDTLSDDS
ncbi:MAG TPA: hypothetical protein VMC06_02405 [Opitutaceae bacterium]|nr:hypothetical protein [Opitutaceae bacterium]